MHNSFLSANSLDRSSRCSAGTWSTSFVPEKKHPPINCMSVWRFVIELYSQARANTQNRPPNIVEAAPFHRRTTQLWSPIAAADIPNCILSLPTTVASSRGQDISWTAFAEKSIFIVFFNMTSNSFSRIVFLC